MTAVDEGFQGAWCRKPATGSGERLQDPKPAAARSQDVCRNPQTHSPCLEEPPPPTLGGGPVGPDVALSRPETGAALPRTCSLQGAEPEQEPKLRPLPGPPGTWGTPQMTASGNNSKEFKNKQTNKRAGRLGHSHAAESIYRG